MRMIKLYKHGLTMSTVSTKPKPPPVKRGVTTGWSESATRRNIAFLRSVDDALLGHTDDGECLIGFGITLTLRDCPASSEDWHKLRRAFFMRLSRMGMYRAHWVTEWQRRGVPHLHGAVWFPIPPSNNMGGKLSVSDWGDFCKKIIQHWIDVNSGNAGLGGQFITSIHDSVGWFKYLSKHAARGHKHYQRSSENIPSGWASTGRVWGRLGTWVITPPASHVLQDSDFFRYRRLVRRWRIADARTAGSFRRVGYARRMLRSNDSGLSRLRGVSEWVPESTSLLMLDAAKATA